MYDELEKSEALAAELHSEDDRVEEIIEELEDLDSLISEEAQELIEALRPRMVSEDVYEEFEENVTFGQRLSDQLASFAGSWTFIIVFVLIMLGWMLLNALLGEDAFDPFPFILLNLTLSTLAALQAPVILMSQNRQGEKDRAIAQNNYQVNLKSEVEIADLHRKVDELTELMQIQSKMLQALMAARRSDLQQQRPRPTRAVGD